jgi:ADP-ribose pyrophosphatase YjhB (NUDIX family)
MENLTREFLSTVYIVRDKKVLLTFNKKVNKFIPLGGHIEQNELPCDSVIREAKEESGFDIKLIDFSEWQHKNLPQNLSIQLDIIKPDHHHINISYIGIITSGEQLSQSDEGTELKWFSEEELIGSDEVFNNAKELALKAIKIVSENYGHSA